MDAPRDCNCFLSENYFVDKIGNRTIRWHFYYNGRAEIIREQLINLGLSDDDGLSPDEFLRLKSILDAERDRRIRLDDEHVRRRSECASRMKGKFNAFAYQLKSSGSDSWLDEKCLAAIEVAEKPGSLRRDVLAAAGGHEVIQGRVFALPILTANACARLDEELRAHAVICSDIKGRPNSMNRYGVLLDEAGMSNGVTEPLLHEVPLSRAFFGEFNSESCSSKQGAKDISGDNTNMMLKDMCDTLDHHHAFTVDYKSDPGYDRGLSLHYDNAEVTLNVLIGGDHFEGGELSFEGPSHASPPSFGKLNHGPVPYEHKLGWGVFHLGSELHRALPLEEGSRRNLIVWCRSAKHRLEHGCAMCGSKDRLIKSVLQRHVEKTSQRGPFRKPATM